MALYDVSTTEKKAAPSLVAGGTLYADSPIGTIVPFGGASAPSGWFLCDGTAISRTTYSELFAVIGESFGAGDGSTTFNIPDMRETVPVGIGENDVQTIGNHDVYTLGQFKDDTLGTHNHPLVSVTTATFNTAGVPVGIGNNNTPTTATHGKQLGVNYIIKAKMVAVPADFLAKVDEAVVEKNEYSTTETVVGKWIDGKPIYRKAFHYDSLTVAGDYLVGNNVENIISQGGSQVYDSTEKFIFPWIFSGSTSNERLYFLVKNNNGLYRRVEYDVSKLSDMNWWVEYTKTTD